MALRQAAAEALAEEGDFDANAIALGSFLAETAALRVAVDTTGEACAALRLAKEWNKALILDGLSQADPEIVGPAMADAVQVRIGLEVPLYAGPSGAVEDIDLERLEAWQAVAPTSLAVRVGSAGRWTWIGEAATVAGQHSGHIAYDAAHVLDLDDRVGRLAPGLDADFVVFHGEPLAPAVEQVFIDGEVVYDRKATPAPRRKEAARKGGGSGQPGAAPVVVRGGTLWTGDARR